MVKVISLSGGLDSTTLLAHVLKSSKPEEVVAVSFHYGSRHNPYEHEASARVAAHYGVTRHFMDLSGAFAVFKSSLLADSDSPIPEGHYEAESMRQTVVPCRNAIFSSILAGLCESLGGGEVFLGVHRGDHFIYPDCRTEFVRAMERALSLATDTRVKLKAPFSYLDKGEILKLGLELGVPYQITRTCYSDSRVACGRCGACQERLEAFLINTAEDPLPYLSREILPRGV